METQSYEEFYRNVFDVRDIFNEYYGKENVDLQDILTPEDYKACPDTDTATIIVHFPHVRITNEHDRFVDVNHLWAKIIIGLRGTFVGFFLGRSEFQVSHIIADYMHSHCNGIPDNYFSRFCFGKGPIIKTMTSLAVGFDEDLWKLFCLELEKVIRTESLQGVPYRHLEYIGNKSPQNVYYDFFSGDMSVSPNICNIKVFNFKDFIEYLLSKQNLIHGYNGRNHIWGRPFYETEILFSNCFIEWFNSGFCKVSKKVLFDNKILFYGKLNNYKIYKCISAKEKIQNIKNVDTTVLTFKGIPVKLKIVDDTSDEDNNKSVFLSLSIVSSIINIINVLLDYVSTGNAEQDSERNFVLL